MLIKRCDFFCYTWTCQGEREKTDFIILWAEHYSQIRYWVNTQLYYRYFILQLSKHLTSCTIPHLLLLNIAAATAMQAIKITAEITSAIPKRYSPPSRDTEKNRTGSLRFTSGRRR